MKKLISTVLVLSLVLSLSACAGKETEENATETTGIGEETGNAEDVPDNEQEPEEPADDDPEEIFFDEESEPEPETSPDYTEEIGPLEDVIDIASGISADISAASPSPYKTTSTVVFTVSAKGLRFSEKPVLLILPEGTYANYSEAIENAVFYQELSSEKENVTVVFADAPFSEGSWMAAVYEGNTENAFMANTPYYFEIN